MVRFNFARHYLQHLKFSSASRYYCSAAESEVKKLTIRNVFKDNPSAKYYLLTVVTVAAGVTYYVYNNQQKKKFVLNLLPSCPNHYIVPQNDKIDELKSLLGSGYGRMNQVRIFGPPGSGKTQLARLLAECLNQSRKESFQFKLWPKDEVTVTVLARSKESLLSSLKQLASKLGCEKDEMKLEGCDLEKQLDLCSQAVKEKLKQKKCWIMVVDDHDQSKQLTKWLPDPDWGNGYVIHTINSENAGVYENQDQYASFKLDQMSSESAKQFFSGVINGITTDLDNHVDPPENILSLLQYNPLSIACAAIYFKYKFHQNSNYSHQNLYTEIDEAVKQLQKLNPSSSKLQIIQSSSVALATKQLGECSPELLHVFDLLGTCNVKHPIPVTIFSHHLKTSEFHVQLKKEETPEQVVSNEESNLSSSFEQEHSLWSFRGIVDRAVQTYERIKLEINAIRGLFGYGDAAFQAQITQNSDGLEVIRTCPLLIMSHEPMTNIEVVSVHPIVHNILRQVFLNVTIPLLERQHLLLAERKHQHKSYFGRLQRFDPQSFIAEYRKGLGDSALLDINDIEGRNDRSQKQQACVAGILCAKDDGDNLNQSKNKNTSGHIQDHLRRVVNSLSNHYRIAGGDNNALVARAMLKPHLETVLSGQNLTAASKVQVYCTLASIHSDVLGDFATGKQLLSNAYTISKQRSGEGSLEIAGILTAQSELCSSAEELNQSKVLLERAVEIYQKHIKASQTNKQPLEYGKALVALGLTCGSLGETNRSKDLLEKGLMELQNAAPEDPQAKENKWFAAEISSVVTNLGHAYLSLGKINQGRKMLELALIGHQNVYGDAHDEIIRTLTTLSIAHAMQGNGQESKRLRKEAGKIQKKLDMKTPLFLH